MTDTSSSGGIADTSQTCNDWTTSTGTSSCYVPAGLSSMTTNWSTASCNNCYSSSWHLFCLSADPGTDTTPSMPNVTGNFTYAIQVPTSTLTTSNAVTVAGLGPGVAATVTITGSSGSPGFKVNGVTGSSGVTTVSNGDSLELFMTSAATASTSYSMTVTVGSGSAVTWRVWTGDPTGSVVKRVFVTDTMDLGSDLGGVGGSDSQCQSRATSAGLGGTWKAITSGQAESEWAINRIGYNWTTLRRIDSVDVVSAGNIWSGTLLNPINISQTGVTRSTSNVASNTKSNGFAYATSGAGACYNWASATGSSYSAGTSGSVTSTWIDGTGSISCGYSGAGYLDYIYCIEQ